MRLFCVAALYETVAAALSAVDNGERVVVVLILEDEERVFEQVHLQDRLFSRHGLDRELLGADDGEVRILLFILSGESRRFVDGRVDTQFLFKTGLVLSDLTFYGGFGGVDRGVHIARRLGDAIEHAVVFDGHLGSVPASFDLERDESFRFRLKEAIQLSELFLRVLVQIIGSLDLLFGECELPRSDLTFCC